MAELTPIPAAQRPAEPGYQPLSGYAVAAVIVAGAFAVPLVGLVLVGLVSHRTPLSYELLLIPVVGLILSIIARSHIRNAEGTWTGTGLANAAWWVCVLGGAGFAAFLAANDFALPRVAAPGGRVLRGPGGRAHPGGVRQVRPPAGVAGPGGRGNPRVRTGVRPLRLRRVREPPGRVRRLREDPGRVRVEHVGARDIGQEGEGFKATHKYRVTIPEGVFTTHLKLVASEPKGGGKPQWHVEFGRSAGMSMGMTYPEWEYFRGTAGWRCRPRRRPRRSPASGWATSAGRLGQAALYTRPRPERDRGEAQLAAAADLAGGPLLAAPVGAPGLPQPTVDELLKSGLFRRDAAGDPVPDAKLEELRKSWSMVTITPVMGSRWAMMGLPEGSEKSNFALTATEVVVGMRRTSSSGAAAGPSPRPWWESSARTRN